MEAINKYYGKLKNLSVEMPNAPYLKSLGAIANEFLRFIKSNDC